MNKLDMPTPVFVPVESDQIREIAYDPETQLMRVKFAPRKDGTQAVYEYQNVDTVTYAELMAAPKMYSYFAKFIKASPDSFPYRKVEA